MIAQAEANSRSASWLTVQLDDLCEISSKTLKPQNYPDLPYIGLEHFDSGGFRISRKGSARDFKSTAAHFEKGDILYSKLRPYLDKAAVADCEGLASTEVLVLRPRPEVPPLLLLAILHSKGFIDYAQSSADKQYPRTSWPWIRKYAVSVPADASERRGLSNVLAIAHEALDIERRLIDTARELKQAALQKLFTEGLRGEAQKETEIGPVPESWDVVELGSIAKIGNGSTPRKSMATYWDEGSIPWLTSAKVHDRNISTPSELVTDRACRECHLPLVPKGSLVIAITGQGKTLGNVARLEIEATISQHLAFIRISEARASTEFVRGFLESRYESFRQVSQAGGSTKGALTCGFLRKFKIPLPKLRADQDGITDVLDGIHCMINYHESRLKLLQEMFQRLLHDLMTGRRRVRDLDLEKVLGKEVAS